MRRTVRLLIFFASCFALGCSSPEKKLKEAYAAENRAEFKKAADTYASLCKDITVPVMLPDAQKGKILEPSVWKNEVEKYTELVSEPADSESNALCAALMGLERCMENIDSENSFRMSRRRTLKPAAFQKYWNTVFTPPPPGAVNWTSLVNTAREKNFSILQISSEKNYSYEFSIINRSTSRRIEVSLYPESKQYVPLAPGEYVMLCTSWVKFQEGQQWKSSVSALPVSVPARPSLLPLAVRTSIPRQSK